MPNNGYTSVTAIEGQQYGGEWQIQMCLESMRDIGPFSVNGDRELLLPRGIQLRYDEFIGGYRHMSEVTGMNVKENKRFSREDEFVSGLIGAGYSEEKARRVYAESIAATERWRAKRGQPISKEEQERMNDMYERMQAEATAGLTK